MVNAFGIRAPVLEPAIHSKAVPQRTGVLVFGAPDAHSLKAVAAAAEDARLGATIEPTLRELDLAIERSRPAAILVDGERGVEQACLHFRYNPALANVPILAVASEIYDLSFEELFGCGGDDLAPRGNREALARRFRAVARDVEAPLVLKRRGTAVVVDTDRRRRILVGRALRNAGFSVSFALDADEAIREASAQSVELVISSAAVEIDQKCLVARAREAGVACPWVIGAPPKETARLRSMVRGLPKVAVFDCFGPPENVLFVANELARSAGTDGRSSARLLYGTSVRFRVAGSDTDEIGYTYNVSAGGVYVRTLAPLPKGSDAWIELRPPRSDRRVRLEGRVIWTRGFGPNDSATVPPGFGIQIIGGSTNDVTRYQRGYDAFASEILGMIPS